MDRLLLFTTAVVGIISLIATMVVQYETQQRFQRVEIEMDNIRVNIDRAATEAREAIAAAESASVPVDDGSIDAILALRAMADAEAAVDAAPVIALKCGEVAEGIHESPGAPFPCRTGRRANQACLTPAPLPPDRPAP